MTTPQKWHVPANPIAQQAETRGEPMPIGETAAALTARGYDVPAAIPPAAVLAAVAESPTGYAWRWVGSRFEAVDAPLNAEERAWYLAT
jgi:hypothetical protein